MFHAKTQSGISRKGTKRRRKIASFPVRLLLCLLVFFCVDDAVAQADSSFRLVRTLRGDIVDVAVDHLDNIYLISSTGQIKKLNASGDSLAVYNQVRNSGQPHTIDVSNPLKILLFYKDFSTVVVLDRFLSVRGTLELRKFNILQPGAVGLSYDNNIWVFDEYDSRLKKIDEQGNSLMETTDLRNVFPEAIAPQKIVNRNGFVYLADTALGIFAFDNYGAFKRKIPVSRWSHFEILKDEVVTVGNGIVSFYNPANLRQADYRFSSFHPYHHSFLGNGRLLTLSKDSLQVYELRR
jgi:hypothetical protein